MRRASRIRPLLVLIVDDNADNRDLYARYFASHGIAVDTASDGHEAVTKAAARRPAVIVMDLGLPGLDGWETIRLMRSRPVLKEVPILAVTGHAHGNSRERALAAGADAYLTKPCLPSDLLRELRKWLARP